VLACTRRPVKGKSFHITGTYANLPFTSPPGDGSFEAQGRLNAPRWRLPTKSWTCRTSGG
jgi:hypothetical protein